MQMRICFTGVGVSIPGTSISLGIFSGVYLQVRSTKESQPTTLGLVRDHALGHDSKTVGISWIKTNWFFVDPVRHPWVRSPRNLSGQWISLSLSGTVAGHGHVDIDMLSIDQASGESLQLLHQLGIKCIGFEADTAEMRGKALWLPSPAHHQVVERVGYHSRHRRGAMAQ